MHGSGAVVYAWIWCCHLCIALKLSPIVCAWIWCCRLRMDLVLSSMHSPEAVSYRLCMDLMLSFMYGSGGVVADDSVLNAKEVCHVSKADGGMWNGRS